MGSVGPGLGLYVGNLKVLWGLFGRVWSCMLATYYGVCWAGFRAVYWQPTGLMGSVGPGLGLYVGNLQVLWGCVGPGLGLYVRKLQISWGLQPTGLMGSVGLGLGLYVGNLQVLWGLLGRAWGFMLATYRSYGSVGLGLGLYVGNLQVLWDLLGRVSGCMLATWQPTSLMGVCWAGFGAVCWQATNLMGSVGRIGCCMLATYKSYGLCWAGSGAVCWQPTSLLGSVGPGLGLYVGNLQTYGSYGLCWAGLGAVWWQPTSLMGSVGPGLGLYVGNLQVLWGLLDWAWGCMLATYRSYGICWAGFGAVCWQPTGLMGSVGLGLGLYVGNLQVLWGLLGWAWGFMLATYKSYGVCWAGFGAVCWQPTSLMGVCWAGFGAVCWQPTGLMGLLDWVWGCMLATYRSYGVCWAGLGAVCWQPTSLMESVGPGLGLYVGNLQVLWGLLGRAVGPGLGLYVGNLQVLWVCWTGLGAVCWQPTSLMGSVGLGLGLYVGNLQVLLGPGLGLYVGNLQVLWVCWTGLGAVCWQPTGLMGCLLGRVWGCMLATYRSYGSVGLGLGATYRSYGVCWTELGAVCWQPTCLMGSVGLCLGLYVGNLQVLWGLLDRFGAVCWQPASLMRSVGPSLGLYVGNLQVLWGLLDWAWGCMLATYRSYGVCWAGLGAVCWQPTGLMGSVGLGLGLYVGNLQVLWGLLEWAWGCMLATYKSYGVCWTGLGAVCWQPTGLMGSVGLGLGLLGWAWGFMLATYKSYGVCWAGFGAVCWQPSGLMGSVGLGLGLYVGNLQVLWGLLGWAWGFMLATYKSYGVCWAGFGAVCWQPTGLMGSVGLGLGL